MEQIYSIPVNEAFDKVRENKACGCPLCMLYRKLEDDELDIILGASMMEPDIRIKTNEQGFCNTHYKKMLIRRRMLGMGLILESHLAEVEKKVDGKGLLGRSAATALSSLLTLEGDCYVCSRINKNLNAMTATVCYLWESEAQFREKFRDMPFFCLPHYRAMLDYASKKMSKRNFRDFYDMAHALEMEYVKTLENDVSWFCKKFDYRYDEEPWYNAKDSVPRAIRFLTGASDEDNNPK